MTYDRKDIATLADEYVLGLTESATATEIEEAMERDPELKAAIAASRERFLPLDTAVTPATVNEALWHRIESALPAQHAKSDTPVPRSRMTITAKAGRSRRFHRLPLHYCLRSVLATASLHDRAACRRRFDQ